MRVGSSLVRSFGWRNSAAWAVVKLNMRKAIHLLYVLYLLCLLVHDAIFQLEFPENLRWWVDTTRKVALRAFDLIEAIIRDPFRGTGKLEPLKHLAAGVWSRRLTQEHLIVYLVSDDRIDFLQARYHYRGACRLRQPCRTLSIICRQNTSNSALFVVRHEGVHPRLLLIGIRDRTSMCGCQ